MHAEGDTTIPAQRGYVECGLHFEEATFEGWLDHIRDKHLEREVLGDIACPLCSERHPLGEEHNEIGDYNRPEMKWRVLHLIVHFPWLAGRCEWPLWAYAVPASSTQPTDGFVQ